MRSTGGEGVDLIIDALGPSSFRKDYRLLRPGGRLVMYGLSEKSKEGKRSIPATLREPRADADCDDALVEEPDGDEREQRASSGSTCSHGGNARATSTASPSR